MSTRKTRGDSGWEWSFYCHPDNLTLCPCSTIQNGVWIMIMKASKWWGRWPQAPLLSLRRSLMPVSAPLNGSRSMGSALAHSRPSPFPKRQRQTGSSELSRGDHSLLPSWGWAQLWPRARRICFPVSTFSVNLEWDWARFILGSPESSGRELSRWKRVEGEEPMIK